jgi:two-component system chemotaxis sensor kinase CheA
MGVDISQFHQVFFEESFEGLDTMESALLGLDVGTADPEIINTIFRAAHSIKGGAGTFGFSVVADFTHVVETLLDEVRDGKRQVSQEMVTLLLTSVDVMRAMLESTRDGTELDAANVADVQKQLETLLGSSGDDAAAEAEAAAVTPASDGWKIVFEPQPHLLQTGNDPARIFRELEGLGGLDVTCDAAKLPGFTDLDPESSYLKWTLELHGDIAEEQVREVFEWVEDDCELDITPLTSTAAEVVEAAAPEAMPAPAAAAEPEAAPQPEVTATPAAQPAAKPATRSGGEGGSIRVDIDKVDAIINLVGELVITQSMLGQMGADLEDVEELDVDRFQKLSEGLAQLERNTRELQESVMQIRMLPISFAFNRFPRLVRDLTQKMGKKINLNITGEGTELDKTLMEKIGDPLVHLVRNALDHGIEMPDDRIAAGKPEAGTVDLEAYHKGGNIVIEIRDDGAGINRDKLLSKARERGLVGEHQQLADNEILELIFHPGFSTAEVVSDISGRGVGMDVVRKNIKSLGGSVEIRSELGKGTTFMVRLPLTLSILDGQLVRVGNETYIVPLVSIVESLQIRAAQVNAISGRAEMYKLRDEYIPIIRLHDTFGMPTESRELDGGLMVVVEGDGRRAGLVVDDLLAQQQVVIKSLETNYQKVEGLSGATILGDGTVALILDTAGLVTLARTGAAPGTAAA